MLGQNQNKQKQGLCFHNNIRPPQFLQLLKMLWLKEKRYTRFLGFHELKGRVKLKDQFLSVLFLHFHWHKDK